MPALGGGLRSGFPAVHGFVNTKTLQSTPFWLPRRTSGSRVNVYGVVPVEFMGHVTRQRSLWRAFFGLKSHRYHRWGLQHTSDVLYAEQGETMGGGLMDYCIVESVPYLT